MNEPFPLIGAIVVMIAAIFWGGIPLYIAGFYRKYNKGFSSSTEYIIYALKGDILGFYTNFWQLRKMNGYSKLWTSCIIAAHPFSLLTFISVPIYFAI